MPVVKHFTQAQWDAVARRLDALPPKPAHEHHVTVREAVNAMRSQINDAQQKGYTFEEIVQQLAEEGVCISASTLRYAMQRVAKDHKAGRLERAAPSGQATAPLRIKKPKQRRSPSLDQVENRDRKDSRRATTNSGAMVIQDAFSFEIVPDTENL
ncbi:TPA: hypothetical protein QDC20_000189 [Burkholderia aenigmatica]|uniref:hypothetical protein n=1 Tax=Burkholderia sp. AU45251 TaxID=3059204 RepID=UPI002656CA5D|nr:hypothetical protein [Burkholderia sp. AU45251]HDR9483095.1 hypothetical protein [Burkholderia aenigmatica]MDN7515959.1 hypothetical protein [Burkholderia sp. AU45251]HDR9514043.1 hypothetical protein [Burkholderia aenigmatica]HDR9591433.1 hypothetical protein [Burkholderia aenigmatica]HDR9598525.1 hypothetical protein [Burkholderia aenigmatica]